MLKDATGFKKIYIAAGKTDFRKGMDSLAAIVSLQFELDSYETDILFLFCGSTRRVIKVLYGRKTVFALRKLYPLQTSASRESLCCRGSFFDLTESRIEA